MRFIGPVSLVFATLVLGACTSTPTRDGPQDVPSFDGLVPLPGTVMDRVWIREGYTLSEYSKVILESAHIQFRPVTRTTAGGLKSPVNPFPLSPDQKAEIGRLVGAAFDESLTRLVLTRVSEPGPDVLRVRGTLLDLAIRPSKDGAAPYRVESVGQLTFSVELIDSQTNMVLLRAVDTRSARTPGSGYPSATATERPRVRQVIRRWADLLVDALNDLTALDQLQGA